MSSFLSRNPSGVTDILNETSFFIAGAGGLGSNVANCLVRAGAKNITIVDFDVVCESNLNRQFFFYHQIGVEKVIALRENLLSICPKLEINAIVDKLTIENFSEYISLGSDIVFECFDCAESKAELTRFMLTEMRQTPYVAVSGLAGIGPADEIKTTKKGKNFYLVGDGYSDSLSEGTISSRVIATAAMQAHCGIRVLLEN